MSHKQDITDLEATPQPQLPVVRKTSKVSSSSGDPEKNVVDHDVQVAREVAHDEEEIAEEDVQNRAIYERLRPFIHLGLALLILGWWISATVLKDTRHRWYVY